MQFAMDDALTAFQGRVRAHIDAHRPDLARLPGTRSPEPSDMPAYRAWCASLFSAGLLGTAWPSEWGGTGEDQPLLDFVLDEELANAQLPRPIGAWSLVSTALLAHGTDEQRERYLPRIRSFQDMWCQLFSEPEAGSDLASLRCTARLEGDEWVVDGQKVWTTHAHVSDLGFLLARTDRDVSKHAGITAFVVDMSAPGVLVRPLRDMTGASDFNEVFLDGLRLPRDAVIGAPGDGWAIARLALAHERSASLREDPLLDKVRRLLDWAGKQHTSDGSRHLDRADVRQSLGRLYARARATELLGVEAVLRDAAGSAQITDAPATKVLFSETNLEVVTTALDLFGPEGLAAEGHDSIDDGYWHKAFLFARGFTISAGSNEIMRNVIAERGLGLPR